MSMTENVEVVMYALFKFSAIHEQEFILLARESLLPLHVGDPAFWRPGVRYAYAQVRMNAREQPLTNAAVEKALNDFVGSVAGAETIAMADEQAMIAYLHDLRFAIDGDAEFF